MFARSVIAASAMGIAIMMGHGVAAQGAEVKVFSTNSPNEVLQELVPQFERSSGHKVTIVYDAPVLLLDRIKKGETADLMIINPNTLDDLAKQGKVVAATKKVLASIGVGVAVRRGLPKPDISTVEAFKNALLAAKSITYNEIGVSGTHFVKVSEQLGIAEQVKAKFKAPRTLRSADLLVTGEADMAVQAIPELLAVSGVDYVGPLPKELQLTTITAIALFAGSRQPEAAETLLKFLTSPTAARVFKDKGMDPNQ